MRFSRVTSPGDSTLIATRTSAPGATRWDCYVRIEKHWISEGTPHLVVMMELEESDHKERLTKFMVFLPSEHDASGSGTTTSDAAVTVSSRTHAENTVSSMTQPRRGPATETSVGSDAPLPFPTPNGDGAVLAGKEKEQPIGAFARSLVIGKPALVAPSPTNNDGQVFVANRAEAEERDTKFARRLRGELSSDPFVKAEPESDEPSRSNTQESTQNSDDDEEDDEEETPEDEDESEEQSASKSDSTFDRANASSEVPEVKREPMDEAAADAAIDRMREARDACAAMIHASIDKYEAAFFDAVAHLNAANPDQFATNRKIAFTTQRLELRNSAEACGFKRKREGNDPTPLEELSLTPFIKRLQHSNPSRSSQYANAKPLLRSQDIGGDVVLELGVSGLQEAGLSLGTAAGIVAEVRKDKRARKA